MNKLTAILFLLPFLTASFAQRNSRVTAWIDVQQTDENAVINCWCQNHSASPLHLEYKAILFIGKDSTIKSGKTLTLPDQPNLLLNANFLVKGGQFDQVQLQIFKGKELVASSNAFGPKPKANAMAESPKQLLPNANPLNAEELEIGGLVLDETRSKLAHDFYEMFYSGWTSIEEDIKTNYTITIREQPALVGNGSRVMVVLDGEELSQLNLQPRAELLESLAMQLVESLYNLITNPEQQYQELDADDISGSGIY